MCEPVTLGSLALSAAGSAVNGYERNRSANAMQNARNAATTQELERQRGYGDRSRAEFDRSLNVFDPTAQAQGLQTAQSSIGDILASNAPTDVGSITTSTAPAAVGRNENRVIGDVFAKAADQSGRTAKLKGYDQQRFNDKLALGQNARGIDMISDLSRTSAGVNQVEQRAAGTNAYRPPSGLGDLLQFAGTVGGYSAGRGGSILDPSRTSTLGFNPLANAFSFGGR
jgi:hypothetical protein